MARRVYRRIFVFQKSVADEGQGKDQVPNPGEQSPGRARHVRLSQQIRECKRPWDGQERAEQVAAGDREQRARMNERKLNEQQGGRDRADHEHCSELSEVGKRHRGKRHCRTEHGEQDEHNGKSEPLLDAARW